MKKGSLNFNEVKETVTFQFVLDHYNLKWRSSKGPELVAHCPFHNDQKPSLSVNSQKGVFFCHGCGAKGDVLSFVSQREGIGITEAALLLKKWHDQARQIEEETGLITEYLKGHIYKGTLITLPHRNNGSGRRRKKEKSPPQTPKAGNCPLSFTLKLEPEHPYFIKRGLDPKVVSLFGLGYCQYGWMKNRMAVPIHDEKGQLVAYAGRWPGDEPPEGEGKYMLPRGFKKSEVLFNLHRVADAELLIIVEGYWSVFRLHQLGLPSVALMGSKLSKAQETLLMASKVRRLILLLDGDHPGRHAQAEILPRLALHFFTKVVELPEGEQPDTVDQELLLELLKTSASRKEV